MSDQWIFLDCMSINKPYSLWVTYNFIVLLIFLHWTQSTGKHGGLQSGMYSLSCCVLRNSMPIGYKAAVLRVRGLECWLATPMGSAPPWLSLGWPASFLERALPRALCLCSLGRWSGNVLDWTHLSCPGLWCLRGNELRAGGQDLEPLSQPQLSQTGLCTGSVCHPPGF